MRKYILEMKRERKKIEETFAVKNETTAYTQSVFFFLYSHPPQALKIKRGSYTNYWLFGREPMKGKNVKDSLLIL